MSLYLLRVKRTARLRTTAHLRRIRRFRPNAIRCDNLRLYPDRTAHGTVDHLGKPRALRLPPIAMEKGSLGGHFADQQVRFNLCSLLKNGKVTGRWPETRTISMADAGCGTSTVLAAKVSRGK